jgi:hypothetical protein
MIEGQSLQDAMRNPYVNFQEISENYFQVMGIPLKAGRFFNQHDGKQSEQVAVVSERLARLLWPERDAIGQRLLYNPARAGQNPFRRVVGIVGNVQHRQLGGEPSLDVYVSYRQGAAANQYILVRHRRSFYSTSAALSAEPSKRCGASIMSSLSSISLATSSASSIASGNCVYPECC